MSCGGKSVDMVVGVFDGRLLTLFHECIHAVSWLLQCCSIDPMSSNEEPLAYLAEHLAEVGAKRLKLR
jgi:hypothetical protein